MGNIVQYSVNIAMEATILLVLIIGLATLLWQKKTFATTVPLIYLTSFIVVVIIVQIVTWVMLIQDVPLKYGAMPMRIVYILDYVFSYAFTVAFYYYIEALAQEEYRIAGVAFIPKKNIKTFMIVWGIVTAVFYSAALFVPSWYNLENGHPVYSIYSYIGMHILSKFACICSLVFVIKHRKIMGTHAVLLSFTFITMIAGLVVVDELLEVCIGHVMIGLLAFLLYVSIDLHKGLLLERQEKEIAMWKTQIMLSQMQPHFIYNVLTTISSMCEMQNAFEARDVVNNFADYFRTNLDSLGKERTILFEKELEHIKTYLWLEKVRFGDDLNVCYEIEETNFAVPSLAIQPIVENAVKHGIHPKDDAGTVTIKTYEEGKDYVIIVEDDGVGFDLNEKNKDAHSHVGIENVSKRLELICNGTCEIQSEKGKGTTVTIRIPKGE